MTNEDFRSDTYLLLDQLLKDATAAPDREELLRRYTEQFTLMHGHYAHRVLDDVIGDVRARLDARLSPDPVRQTIASVQTTVQDFWRNIWKE